MFRTLAPYGPFYLRLLFGNLWLFEPLLKKLLPRISPQAGALLKTPTDVLRYLWYEKTGYVQIIEPKTLMLHADKLYYHMWGPLDMGAEALVEMKMKLMLKYDRKTCLRVAKWLNALPLSAGACGCV